MCGIAGIKRYGSEPISLAEIEILLCSNEIRGNHASGIAIQTGADVVIHKMPLPAWNFVKDGATKAFLKDHLKEETDTVLLHTRFATCGTPMNNDNNHPMFDGTTALVHNGSIRNADEMFKSMNLGRVAETDSDILRAIVAEEGFAPSAFRQMSRLAGNGAIACVDSRFPGKLMLGRSGNPLIIANANDKFYFASTLQAIQRAVRPWENRYGLFFRSKAANFSHSVMADNTAYILSDDETSTHHELKIAVGFQPVIYRSHDNYAEKMRVWRSQTVNYKLFTRCRACGTAQGKYQSSDWKNMKCSKCGESFAYLEGVPTPA